MKSKNTFSILFYIRRDRINKYGGTPICIRVTINNKCASITTGRAVKPELWNPQKGRVKSKASIAGEINIYLELLLKKVYNAHKELLDNNQ